MSVYRILRLSRHASGVIQHSVPYKAVLRAKQFPAPRQKLCRRYASNATPTSNSGSLWNSIMKRWEWSVPVGVGISLLAVLQWRHLRKHPYTEESSKTIQPVKDLMVECYCCLPLRITSRAWGWVASIQLPVGLRPTLYGLYARAFSANLQEIDSDLTAFPSLVDFFVRPLKDGVRPIAENTNIVSPSDGKVLHFGRVTSCRVEQVKGVTYSLQHFLGEPSWHKSDQHQNTKIDDAYISSLLKNPANRLYQLTIYLAPGDYHRFHSPTDWRIVFRRHFQGKLLSVNPAIASWLPNLFSLNERVVYIGEWAGGFMAYAAVGATNVGSIKVYCDQDLITNTKKWPKGKQCEDASLGCTNVSKGQVFGEFRMGSTIVMLFEAPQDFKFCLKSGQSIKVGQPLTECYVEREQRLQ